MSATNQRVFLMDGQAVYLEGDGEITEEVLQQALSQLARQGQTIEEADPASLQVAAGTHAPADIQTLGKCRRAQKHREDNTLSYQNASSVQCVDECKMILLFFLTTCMCGCIGGMGRLS